MKLLEGNDFSHVCASSFSRREFPHCTRSHLYRALSWQGPNPALPLLFRVLAQWTCSNLFNLDLTVQYKSCTVSKWATGILLESFLVFRCVSMKPKSWLVLSNSLIYIQSVFFVMSWVHSAMFAGVLYLAGALSQTVFQYSMAYLGFKANWYVIYGRWLMTVLTPTHCENPLSPPPTYAKLNSSGFTTKSRFPVIHIQVGNVGIFVLLKFENKLDR